MDDAQNQFPDFLKPLVPTVEKIREYTAAHSELASAHHFLFGLPHNLDQQEKRVEFVVLGINPGLSAETVALTTDIKPKHPCPIFEESFLEDFQERTKKRAAKSRSWLGSVSV